MAVALLDGTVRVLANSRADVARVAHGYLVKQLQFSSDGRRRWTSSARTFRVSEIDERLLVPQGSYSPLAFDANGEHLLTLDEGRGARLYSARTAELVATFDHVLFGVRGRN